jgi:hypothetical protein
MEHRETGVWNQVQTKTLKENEHFRTEIRSFVEGQLKLR